MIVRAVPRMMVLVGVQVASYSSVVVPSRAFASEAGGPSGDGGWSPRGL